MLTGFPPAIPQSWQKKHLAGGEEVVAPLLVLWPERAGKSNLRFVVRGSEQGMRSEVNDVNQISVLDVSGFRYACPSESQHDDKGHLIILPPASVKNGDKVKWVL